MGQATEAGHLKWSSLYVLLLLSKGNKKCPGELRQNPGTMGDAGEEMWTQPEENAMNFQVTKARSSWMAHVTTLPSLHLLALCFPKLLVRSSWCLAEAAWKDVAGKHSWA